MKRVLVCVALLGGCHLVLDPDAVPPPAPSGLRYSENPAVYTVGSLIGPNVPQSGGGSVDSYEIDRSLPPGLSFNTSIGVISGTPTAISPATEYTVTAANLGGSTSVLLTVTVNACSGGPGCVAPAFPYSPSNFSPAALVVPDAGLIINCDAGYDTGTRTGFLCGAPPPPSYLVDGGASGPLVVVAVSGLTITATGQWHITGPYPLVVAVYGDVGIDGPLLGGASGAIGGPGASWLGCAGTGRDGHDGGNGGGGGGGAGHGRPGARGAVGAGALPAAGGDGGLAFGTPELVPLRAGCPGGRGGAQDVVEPPGGGGGGGAIQLSAAGTVQVTSAIGVPGGGGRGATVSSNNGGGGGGSGGAILLEGKQLIFGGSARVTANGGGGGEGSDGSPSQNGADGRIDGAFPALGGTGTPGFPGGDGGAGTVDATSGPDVPGGNFGGGGGGGGVGRIRLNAAQGCSFESSADQVLSPPATSNRAGDAGCP